MRLKGQIKKIEAGRGSGLIEVPDGRVFFFHRSRLEGLDFEKLRSGDEVEFEFDEFRGPTTPKAPVATIVRPAGGGKRDG
ncbi:MAG TPA: cold shock domain-containing protein [Nitrospiria bacterium]|nr:cold shock domain-containing protein [Nitrospiria bacterium]